MINLSLNLDSWIFFVAAYLICKSGCVGLVHGYLFVYMGDSGCDSVLLFSTKQNLHLSVHKPLSPDITLKDL